MTPRQKECLDYIREYWRIHGFAPSFEEIKVALGAKSKASVTGLVSKLEARGYIQRTPNLARSIRLVVDAFPPEAEIGPDVPPVLEEEKHNPYT
jgi:repressor LexA